MSNTNFMKMVLDFRKTRNGYKVASNVSNLYRVLNKNSDMLENEELVEYFIKDVSSTFFEHYKTVSEWKAYFISATNKILLAIENDIRNIKKGKPEYEKFGQQDIELFENMIKIIKEETLLTNGDLLKQDINGETFADLLLDYTIVNDMVNDKVNFVVK